MSFMTSTIAAITRTRWASRQQYNNYLKSLRSSTSTVTSTEASGISSVLNQNSTENIIDILNRTMGSGPSHHDDRQDKHIEKGIEIIQNQANAHGEFSQSMQYAVGSLGVFLFIAILIILYVCWRQSKHSKRTREIVKERLEVSPPIGLQPMQSNSNHSTYVPMIKAVPHPPPIPNYYR